MAKVYLSLGGNIGDRRTLLQKAIQLLDERVGKVVRRSSLLETDPWGFSSPNKFLNACVCMDTSMTPRELLEVTQQIERELGRTRKTPVQVAGAEEGASVGYADRPIDIDILLYDDLHVDEPDLKIPHPLMQERDFVMIPLREIMKP